MPNQQPDGDQLRALLSQGGGMEMPPPKQTIYPATKIGIHPQPDGSTMMAIETPMDGIIMIPMNRSAALEIGRKLIAPRVDLPGNGQPPV